ncbi:hypothetical protein [Tomitella gaofuii]|uniref:hypothetical protein n=1 Tax=Tomitella gaofuii TaxID=2760083 RepID=UPI0015F7AE33|nr:hypothetical protein [Tomitella gaofuii]
MSPVVLLDAELSGAHRVWSNTSSPGNLTITSTTRSFTNNTGRRLTPMVLQYIGQGQVGLSGQNAGYATVESGCGTTSSITRTIRWALAGSNDNGTRYIIFKGDIPYFTQTDVSSSSETIMLAPPVTVVEPGGGFYVSVASRWVSEQWNKKAVGYDSWDYCDFPYTRIQVLGFPAP